LRYKTFIHENFLETKMTNSRRTTRGPV